jgi:hypothetical protein
MREFTHKERLTAASAVVAQTPASHLLRESTHRLMAEAWAQGEVVYVVSNQYAIQLQCELNLARKVALDIMAFPMRPKEIVWFTPDEIQTAMDKNLAAGLRQLADALDAGAIDGRCIDCQGHGGPLHDDRAHLLLRIDLAAPIKQAILAAPTVDLSSIAPASWEGELTEDKLRSIVAGLMKPNQAMSVRLARELLGKMKGENNVSGSDQGE